MVEYKAHSESSEDRLTDQRKKEIDSFDNIHIFYFRNMYTDEEVGYIKKTRPQLGELIFPERSKI